MTLPWLQDELKDWAIVGMNHYFLGGEKHLFVAMVKGGKCIKAESTDENEVFKDLVKQVNNLEN